MISLTLYNASSNICYFVKSPPTWLISTVTQYVGFKVKHKILLNQTAISIYFPNFSRFGLPSLVEYSRITSSTAFRPKYGQSSHQLLHRDNSEDQSPCPFDKCLMTTFILASCLGAEHSVGISKDPAPASTEVKSLVSFGGKFVTKLTFGILVIHNMVLF